MDDTTAGDRGEPSGGGDLSIGERSLAAALKTGAKWTPALHRQWCDENGESPDAPITVHAEMIRALLFVEGAHMAGGAPPQIEADRLTAYSLDPTRRHIAQALVIDWTMEDADVEWDEVETALEAAGEFEGLDDGRDEEAVEAERTRRIRAQYRWRRLHDVPNRPQILGDLDFTGGRFPGGLVLRGCVWPGGDGDVPTGRLVLDRAELGGLDLTGSALGVWSGDRLQIREDCQAWLLNAERAGLRGVRLGGGLYLPGARWRAVSTPEMAQIALNCDAAEIGADVFLRNGFLARAEVNFVRARIGGNLDCTGGRFEAETGWALTCIAAEIGADVFLSEGLLARAAVDFVRARIGGGLWLHGGVFKGGSGGAGAALILEGARIGATLGFAHPRAENRQPAQFEGHVSLVNAHCAVLDDSDIRATQSGGTSWLTDGAALKLDGFTYDRLGTEAPKDWKARKAWLDRQPETDRKGREFKPQPFEQLAKVIRETGHNAEARSAGLVKQFRMHMRPGLPLSSRLFRRLLLWPSGYGYRPQYPALAGVVLMAVALLIFASAYRQGYVTPAQPHAALAEIGAEVAALNGQTGGAAPACLSAEASEAVPPFNSFAYVVDAFVPLVDIDQESSWKPAHTARCQGDPAQLALLDQVNPGWAFNAGPQTGALSGFTNMVDAVVAWWAPKGGLLWLQWVLMIAGFAISALIAASLSGLIRRD